jgi:hypothetical protein
MEEKLTETSIQLGGTAESWLHSIAQFIEPLWNFILEWVGTAIGYGIAFVILVGALSLLFRLGMVILRFLLGCLVVGSMLLLGLQAWSWAS